MGSLRLALEEHSAARTALIQKERARGHHNLARPLTSKEERAIAAVAKLREEELHSVWRDPETANWLGMPFTSSKEHINQSQLFNLIKEMPKGCLLHCHLDAMNDPQSLLRLALAHPNLVVSSTATLSGPSGVISFQSLPPSDPVFTSTQSISLHDLDYPAGTPIPVSIARAKFPGGEAAFDAFVISKLVVNPESAAWSPAQVWEQFGSTFLVSHGLLHYEPVYEAYIAEVFTICALDNVPYVECRINFLHEFMTSSKGTLDLAHRDWLKLFVRSVEAVTAATAGTPKPFWGAKVIYSTIRFIEPGEGPGRLRWYMEDAIALKLEFPDVIAAFDLVGWEDGLHPLSYYMEDLLWFKERQKEAGVDIPYAFHAGETLGDGSKADLNLYDAVLLDTKRIGHGFSLPQHPLLMEICKERKIAVECCPISNELLRYTASSSTHPLAVLLNNNVPVSLSCDDPQFFGNYGLSYDFYQVFTASEQMDILGLGKLARQSIEYSFMDSAEQAKRLAEFDSQFDVFLDRVLEELNG